MVVLICSIKETTSRYFPGSPVVKNPPCNAGVRFDPWSGN